MGYTHYISDRRSFTEKEWKDFRKEVKELFSNSSVPLADAYGKEGTKPVFGRNYVSFNGVGEHSHETATVSKDGERFEFCKTNRKPYDSVVVEFYKLIRKYTGAKLSSDGGKSVFG